MYVELNNKKKDDCLPFIDLGELENDVVKNGEYDFELYYNESKQSDYYKRVIEKALPSNLVK